MNKTTQTVLCLLLTLGNVLAESAEETPLTAKARKLVLAAHPGMQAADIELVRLDEPDTGEADSNKRSKYQDVRFRVKSSVRKHEVGDMVYTHYDLIKVSLDEDGKPPRWERMQKLPAIAARTGEKAAGKDGEQLYRIRFTNAPLQQLLDFYALLREIQVHPHEEPEVAVTCATEERLPRVQALKFLDYVMAENGVSLVRGGDEVFRAAVTGDGGK